jgi:hypothetical protein
MYTAYLVFFFRIMASITSLLVRKAEIPFKTAPFLFVASMATGIVTNEVSPKFYNRNPRNLERLRIAYKPTGYHLEAPGREFWHKYVYRKVQRLFRKFSDCACILALKSYDGCMMIGHSLENFMNAVAVFHSVLTCYVVE